MMGTQSVNSLVINGNKVEAYKFTNIIITGIAFFFGVNWTDAQIKELTIDFYSQYHYWKSADMKMFLARCKNSFYGKVYGTFSPALLMEWAAIYDEEWTETSARISESKAQSYKAAEMSTSDQSERNRISGETELNNLWNKMKPTFKPNINDNTKL